MASQKKIKSKSVTSEQKQLLISFVTKYPELNTKKFSSKFTYKDAQRLWEEITDVLNNSIGPQKNWTEWRKVI